MSKEKANIVYVNVKIGKGEYILRRYINLVEDTTFKPNMSKPAIYLRQHQMIFTAESPLGRINVFASKKFDTDRKKARKFLEELMKTHKIVGDIKEYKQSTQLTNTEFAQLVQNPDSLEELFKPIVFKSEPALTLYAQGILMIISKLKRLAVVQTPEYRNEVKFLHKLLGEVADKI